VYVGLISDSSVPLYLTLWMEGTSQRFRCMCVKCYVSLYVYFFIRTHFFDLCKPLFGTTTAKREKLTLEVPPASGVSGTAPDVGSSEVPK